MSNIKKPKNIYLKITKTSSTSMKRWITKNLFDISGCFVNPRVAKKFFENNDLSDVNFVFTICRNPFARAVSSWKFLSTRVRRAINEKNCKSLYDFLNFSIQKEEEGDDKFWIYHYQPQVIAINEFKTKTNLDVNFYKLENISESIEIILKKINGKQIYPYPKLRQSPHRPYQEYYDQKTKDLVLKMFEKDFEFFNYSDEL
tara:strand:+ start:435 stop:1037 length:603 start_codon:yes stop_codon:yes gene_type:complete